VEKGVREKILQPNHEYIAQVDVDATTREAALLCRAELIVLFA
jgi:hypothetical protein